MADDRVCYDAVISTPIDAVKLGIRTTRDALYSIDFLPGHQQGHLPRDGFVIEVVDQLGAYFDNPHYIFSLPLVFQGTSFQSRVWQLLQAIPSGVSWSYGKVAQYLGTAPRAVGGACRANPVPVVVPCHRVIASNGIGGFSGQTQGRQIVIKQWLLRHENS